MNVLSQAERKKLLYDFNNTAVDYPRDKCVHELFEEQVQRTPDKTAVIACDKTLTYSELNEQANRIAHGLIEKGVKPGDIVAFMLSRKSYLIATMFGILKAGAAYMPIDPDYPQDRIEYTLADSNAAFCVTKDTILELLSNPNMTNPQIEMSSESVFCCIYTSGSTGKPKGCVLLHRGINNFCINNNVMNYALQSKISLVGASVNNVIFDFFISENISLLLNGYTTVLCNEDVSINPNLFYCVCNKYEINIIQTTPTKYKMLIADFNNPTLRSMKILVTSGEPLSVELLDYFQKHSKAAIFNPLGPSECSVWNVGGEI